MKQDNTTDEQHTRAAHWSMMLANAGKHVDPNPRSPKARANGNAHLRKDDHALNHFKL